MKITIHRNHLLAVVLITQFLTNAFSQQPRRSILEPPPAAQQTIRPESDDVVRITTNLVQVDAVVTDKNGTVVTDLKPGEVQISEDGKQQRITNFSYVVTEAPEVVRRASRPTAAEKVAPPIPSARLKREDVRRTIAVVIDDLGLSFESMYLVRRALRKFVDEQIQPGDLVAIIRTSGGIGALQQLTSDKRQLYAAIERVRWVAAGRSGVGAFAPIISSPNLSMSGGGPAASNDDWTRGEDVDQLREDHFAVGTLGALNYVVKGLRELPGRKSILLLSDGFKLFNRDEPSRSNRVYQAVERLIDQANRAAVVVYTMDARGLQTLNYTAADSFGGRPDQNATKLIGRRAEFSDSQSGLSFLAEQTGGIAIHNNNDLSGGMRRMLEDQRGYYLIGYRPDESTFDVRTGRRKFHHLSLKVTRPGKFDVRMRNGFYGVSNEDAKPPETPIQRMIGALVSPFGSSEVRLQLTSLFTNDAKAGSLMRSMLHIDARDLTFTDEPDGWHKSVFDILAVTFADNGVPIDQVSRTHTVRVRDQTYQRVLRDGFVYAVAVPVKKGGAYQLRVALRDTDSQRVGSASQFVEIPDLKKNRLELSGIAVNGTTAAEYGDATPKSSGANAPATMEKAGALPGEELDDGDAQASPAVRRFHQGLVMQYGYLIFNAQSNKATRQPQLTTQVRLVRDAKVIFTGNEIPFDPAGQADMKRLVVGGAIQLGTELSPGEYVLQVIVTDAVTSEKRRYATQWIDFEIIK